MRKRNSFWGILRGDVSETPQVVVDRVRKAMLSALDQYGDSDSKQQYGLEASLLFATKLEELWYLRPELAQIIALRLDDAHTRQVLGDITQLFEGHIHI